MLFSGNLKAKLEKHCGSHASFYFLGPFSSYIVYKSITEINQIMKYIYDLGRKNKTETSGICLNQAYYLFKLKSIKILLGKGMSNKQRLVNIRGLAVELDPEHCTTQMALYAYSRCDTTSCFKGTGKVTAIKGYVSSEILRPSFQVER